MIFAKLIGLLESIGLGDIILALSLLGVLLFLIQLVLCIKIRSIWIRLIPVYLVIIDTVSLLCCSFIDTGMLHGLYMIVMALEAVLFVFDLAAWLVCRVIVKMKQKKDITAQ